MAALAQAWCDRHIAKTYKHPEVVLRVLRRHIEPVIGKLGGLRDLRRRRLRGLNTALAESR